MKLLTKDVFPDTPNVIYLTVCHGLSVSFPLLHFVIALLLNIATDLDAVRIKNIVGYENVIMTVTCKKCL